MNEFNAYLLITPAVMVFLSISLFITWSYDREQRSLHLMASGILATGLALGAQSLLTPALISKYALHTGVLYLMGAWLVGYSIAAKFKAAYPQKTAAFILLLTLGGLYYFSRVEDSLAQRAHILSAGLGILHILPIFHFFKSRPQHDRIEGSLYWTYWVFSIYTAVRPFTFFLFEQMFVQELVNTIYWFVTLPTSILFSMTFAFLMLGSCIRNNFQKLANERNRDPLTNLLNRRALTESVALQTHHNSNRNTFPISIVMGDIDHFKQINDVWGHDEGDEVLRKLAQCLNQSTRNTDLVARFGGEEFVMVLPRTDTDTAHKITQRVQHLLQEGHCVLPDASKVTMSFGIASLLPNDALEDALKRADIALYQAKQTGRNRICLHELTA